MIVGIIHWNDTGHRQYTQHWTRGCEVYKKQNEKKKDAEK
jgi:hypothetical protein